MKLLVIIATIIFYTSSSWAANYNLPVIDTPLLVRKCNDFSVNGKGDNGEWQKTKWVALNKINEGGKNYESKFKIMYSATGMYVLFNGEDDKITSAYKNDFDSLFFADVFEVFFHPDISEPVYFEYEISPLNKELVLLILNRKGKMGGWVPWHYGDKNKIIKNVNINGGQMEPGASIKSWSAEIFFPYKILNPLLNVPPVSGMRWNANFCRLDYDTGNQDMWSWSPVKKSFHEFKKYYSLQFE
jgi:cellulose/xylan binding protein with CBM9 domain